MRILHSSDLHGRYKRLFAVTEPFDVWVDTGDFIPNRGRVPRTAYTIDPGEERRYQVRWFAMKRLPGRIAAWLGGRPAVVMPGNHDFVNLAMILQRAGVDVRQPEPDGIDHAGLRWAGFREIPAMSGEWPGETHDFTDLLERVVRATPGVLITHAPPEGVLDGVHDYGIPGLGDLLRRRMPDTHTHLFGHEHDHGGQHARVAHVDCYNGAETVRIIEIPTP
ncbi:MAG: metallophosphoesterase [Myxococcota bacterium]